MVKSENSCSARVLAGTDIKHVYTELQHISCNEGDIEKALETAGNYVIKVENISGSILPEISDFLLSNGGYAAVPSRTQTNNDKNLAIIIIATRSVLRKLELVSSEKRQELQDITRQLQEAVDNYQKTEFVVPYPGGSLNLSSSSAIMGVVNITPDSFSDGGDFYSHEKATEHALELTEAGASIIDIGGESTRPGSDPLSIREEIDRVIPVIEALNSKCETLISIDTYKPEVAREALSAGAKMVNDVTGFRESGKMAEIVADSGVPVILMHMKGLPKTMQDNPVYEDLILEIYDSLTESVKTALSFGIEHDKLIVDPGIGFGKSYHDNLVILDRLKEFKSIGSPICVGASRKAFLGAVLNLNNPKDRLAGTLSASVIAIRNGARIVRVHDVKEAYEAATVADAIASGNLPLEN